MMISWVKSKISLIDELLRLPVVTLSLGGYKEIYDNFTKAHPKCPFFQKKTIGVALLPIVGDSSAYLLSVNGKNSAAYYARKAKKNGYVFMDINPNEYLEDIYNINTSKKYRQGRLMSESYTKKIDCIEIHSNFHYYGVLSKDGKLVAYAWVPNYGDVWILSTLLGHDEHLNNGVMYMLVTDVIVEILKLSEGKRPKFLMYDTWYGAQEGLKMFKKKLGFRPYRVKWRL